MVQCFDWKVLGGDGPDGSKVNMDSKSGVVKSMDKPFVAIPVVCFLHGFFKVSWDRNNGRDLSSFLCFMKCGYVYE
jgi:hypothetical protein